jgi:hypothetical protein
MSYAEARSKLANILIKAGYNKAKSLRAVKYPYIESMQLSYNSNINSVVLPTPHKFYEDKNNTYIEVKYNDPNNGNAVSTHFVYLDDENYGILGEKNKVKAYVEVTQDRFDSTYNFGGLDAVWFSFPLGVRLKYRHTYPKNEIIDSFKEIGRFSFGFTEVTGIFGIKEGTMPLPEGGWIKVIS